jgi:hypothetical protein
MPDKDDLSIGDRNIGLFQNLWLAQVLSGYQAPEPYL